MGRRRVVVAIVGAGAVAAAGVVLSFLPAERGPRAARAAGTAVSTPAPADPLTGAEIERAEAVASAVSRQAMSSGRVRLLYVERGDDKDPGGSGDGWEGGSSDGGHRLAEAYLYDYGTDTLTVRTVDLAGGRVVKETVSHGVQPPPSKAEELTAAELLLAHSKLGEGVRRAYALVAGGPPRSASDLGLRGLIFTPSQEEGGAATRCATHRCMRLFVRLPGGRWLDTSRIVVDLSAKKIHVLEW
ncbi:hypothetical protein [Streptosporangium carneum]|uniref:Tat pathway signal sequence domain protein n=1 Tax=Streptosporangium carneum TaxID=47481 RepID=A0A9W6MGM3_9ACTN|nr:hypothetical protein [Streptosporangium carneum]GLK13078.1 hypothetical protein GCM10017600_64890 [Streptosporangium carneum]